MLVYCFFKRAKGVGRLMHTTHTFTHFQQASSLTIQNYYMQFALMFTAKQSTCINTHFQHSSIRIASQNWYLRCYALRDSEANIQSCLVKRKSFLLFFQNFQIFGRKVTIYLGKLVCSKGKYHVLLQVPSLQMTNNKLLEEILDCKSM